MFAGCRKLSDNDSYKQQLADKKKKKKKNRHMIMQWHVPEATCAVSTLQTFFRHLLPASSKCSITAAQSQFLLKIIKLLFSSFWQHHSEQKQQNSRSTYLRLTKNIWLATYTLRKRTTGFELTQRIQQTRNANTHASRHAMTNDGKSTTVVSDKAMRKSS